MFWAEAAAGDTGFDIVSQVLQWGPPGIVIALILTGVLVTKGQLAQMKQDRDDWRAAYELERAAHAETRSALADSTKTAAASLEVAKTTQVLLTNLGHIAGSGK